MKPCPKCGKPMFEQAKFRGLWTCPDYSTPINAAPPFEYKCDGMELTAEGVANFDRAIIRVIAEQN